MKNVPVVDGASNVSVVLCPAVIVTPVSGATCVPGWLGSVSVAGSGVLGASTFTAVTFHEETPFGGVPLDHAVRFTVTTAFLFVLIGMMFHWFHASGQL